MQEKSVSAVRFMITAVMLFLFGVLLLVALSSLVVYSINTSRDIEMAKSGLEQSVVSGKVVWVKRDRLLPRPGEDREPILPRPLPGRRPTGGVGDIGELTE